ncbi:MAG TPA: AraC family ligand binding domain-containing protein [Patescibacteria group bacterium]|nr:AraC family ligand binding domain-containing protein [Patescibacteria group bacterium]
MTALDGPNRPGVPAAEARLREHGVEPYAWSNGPGDRYGAHEHGFTKLLVCAEGSITFLVGEDAEPVELVAGEGFVLPAGTRHAAVVGPDGCTCLEGHRA